MRVEGVETKHGADGEVLVVASVGVVKVADVVHNGIVEVDDG